MDRDTTTIRIKKTTKERLDKLARLFTADGAIQTLLNLWDNASGDVRQDAVGWDWSDMTTGQQKAQGDTQ